MPRLSVSEAALVIKTLRATAFMNSAYTGAGTAPTGRTEHLSTDEWKLAEKLEIRLKKTSQQPPKKPKKESLCQSLK